MSARFTAVLPFEQVSTDTIYMLYLLHLSDFWRVCLQAMRIIVPLYMQSSPLFAPGSLGLDSGKVKDMSAGIGKIGT